MRTGEPFKSEPQSLMTEGERKDKPQRRIRMNVALDLSEIFSRKLGQDQHNNRITWPRDAPR